MTARVETFNEMVGLIFAQLYEAFPMEIDLDEGALGDAMGVNVIRKEWPGGTLVNFDPLPNGDIFRHALYGATRWLREEGYIRATGDSAVHNMVLTTKALAILNKTPESVGGETLGTKLSKAAGHAGSETGKAVMGELVGQVLGGLVKSFGG